MTSSEFVEANLAHGISVLSRYMSEPGREHWLAMKWLLRYISSTTNVGLIYTKSSSKRVDVAVYVDSDFAGDRDTRRSTTAFFFCMSWKVELQPIVTLSTIEAEYIAGPKPSRKESGFKVCYEN